MRLRNWSVLIWLAWSSTQAQSPPPLPTWKDEIANPETSFWVKPFIDYYYHSFSKSTPGCIVYAYVTEWTIFSGLDKNDTSRRSKAGNIKDELPYAQAVLDLNEIYARQMAAVAPGEFPSGKGDSFAAARADLDARVKAFCNERFKAFKVEQEALVKETKQGQNKIKVRELASIIRKRLDAVPATPAPSASSTSSATPAAGSREPH
jgi:hypothetical protein